MKAFVKSLIIALFITSSDGLGQATNDAAAQATYYIATNGNDNNAGTSPEQAWKTINRVNQGNYFAGDKIFFEGGQTFSGSLQFNSGNAHGTPDSPITIGSYGSGRATIQSGLAHGLYVYNTGGIRVDDLIFIGTSVGCAAPPCERSGIYCLSFSDANDNANDTTYDYIHIDNVEASGYRMAGIAIGSWDGTSNFQNVRITNVVAHDNGFAGIRTFSRDTLTYAVSNIYVAHSVAHNNHGYPESPVSGCGIWLQGVNGGMVEYCAAHDNGGRNGNQPGGGPIGIFAFWSNNITFQHNESYNNKTGNFADGGGFDFDWWTFNSVMQYNYSHGNDGAGFLICGCVRGSKLNNITVRYNISENDGRRNFYPGIYITGGSHQEFKDVKVYNNTVYKSGGSPVVRVSGGGSTYAKISLRNNILIASDNSALVVVNDPQNATELFFQGNDYWSTSGNYSIRWGSENYRTIQNWSNFTGQEKLNDSAVWKSFNPLLTNAGGGGTIYPDPITKLAAYRLQSGSPMIDAGLNLKAHFGIDVGARDFYGNPIPGGNVFDIGANEASPAAGINGGHDAAPFEYVLDPSYPNPFKAITSIRFSLPQREHVTLKVFDVNGREVATLVEGNLAAGNHAVTFAPRETTTGIYFYKLIAGKFLQTRKAVLIK